MDKMTILNTESMIEDLFCAITRINGNIELSIDDIEIELMKNDIFKLTNDIQYYRNKVDIFRMH